MGPSGLAELEWSYMWSQSVSKVSIFTPQLASTWAGYTYTCCVSQDVDRYTTRQENQCAGIVCSVPSVGVGVLLCDHGPHLIHSLAIKLRYNFTSVCVCGCACVHECMQCMC